MSIPRTSPQSKSARLALAATGTAAAVAVLVSGGAAAAGGGPAPSYRIAASSGPAAYQITADSVPHAGAAGQASAAGRTSGTNRTPASQHTPASQRKAAGKLRLAFGDKLADATRGTSSRRPSQRRAPTHRGQSARAHPRACANSTLHWWICHVEHVLERHGTPRSRLSTNAAYIVVEHESGGNPHAYNGWDINAARGHPSEGIAQVIGPTFHSYALHGYGDIWNPVDNMIAAFRYAISRYGSMDNIPGVVAVHHGDSYVGY